VRGRRAWGAVALLLAALGPSGAAAPTPASRAASTPAGLPPIGSWMIGPDGAPSHWLGEIIDGKALREPINVVILDPHAKTAEEAVQRLLAAMPAAGFASRFGHSSGYTALIGTSFYPELPKGREHAFSDDPFVVANDHGRIFGPHAWKDGFVFTGAFSRETVDPLARPGHRYASFNQARDRLARNLDARTRYKLAAFANLGNTLLGDPAATTGDHDGMAVVLVAEP